MKYRCTCIGKEFLHLPDPDYVDRVVSIKDRKPGVLRSLQALYGQGRLANTGYLSLLPVDQGVEHSAGASFAPNPIYFDPDNIVRLAIEGDCNGVASTLGVLGSVANCYMGRVGMINSGGESGKNDLQQAVRTAVINNRAGGMGLISGRKAFQKPMQDGVALLNAIQDVYLAKDVTVA